MENAPHEISTCEVCGNERLVSVLDLGLHPMCDDLVPVGDSRSCVEYPIEILFCDQCITAHQRFQVPKRIYFRLPTITVHVLLPTYLKAWLD